MKYLGIIVMVGTLSLASCKKYDDGPGLSLKSKKARLARSWNIESYHLNGVDMTNTILISNYTENYDKEGAYTRSYTDTDGESFSETGSWEFDSDKEQINIFSVGSLELTDEHSTVSTSDYNILRLTSKELWYEYNNGGATHEFRMTAD